MPRHSASLRVLALLLAAAVSLPAAAQQPPKPAPKPAPQPAPKPVPPKPVPPKPVPPKPAPKPAPKPVVPKPADERREPARRYTLVIDGKRHPILPGQPFKLPAGIKQPTVVLEAAPTRRFGYAGVRFDYPASWTWEADLSTPDAHSWTISGNDAKLMIFRTAGQGVLERTANQMIARYGKGNCKVSAGSIKLGGKAVPTRRIDATIAGLAFRQELLAVPGRPKLMLIIQDSPQEGGKSSADMIRLRQLLDRSFKLKP